MTGRFFLCLEQCTLQGCDIGCLRLLTKRNNEITNQRDLGFGT